jgi:hypothetical protein
VTIPKHQAIEIARGIASRSQGAAFDLKPGFASAELRDSDAFSRSLGVDCRHWSVVFECDVPEGVVLCPDEIIVLVAESSGAATLATLM